MRKNILSYLLMLLLAGCRPGLIPVARPTPAVLAVQLTPALQPVRETLRGCVDTLENTGLVLVDTPAQSLDLKRAALALRWGPGKTPAGVTPAGYTAVVGQETLALVSDPQNPLTRLSVADLRAIYSGARRDWMEPAQGQIQPYVYPAGDDTQAIFESTLLAGQPASQRVIYLAPDPAAMREAVSNTPGAIGFLPRRWLDSSVKEIAIDGLDAAVLRQPILALSQAEPQGRERAWLVCLQESLTGQ